MTQLDLALSAGSTARYVSFVETGRSRPRRDVVLRFARALDVPLQHRNTMLVAAGLRPEFRESAYGDDHLEPIRAVVTSLLRGHEPYPAWCWGPGLRVLASNHGAEALFPGLGERAPEEIVDFVYGSVAFADLVENAGEVRHAGLGAMRREQLLRQDDATAGLLRRAEGLFCSDTVPSTRHELPVVCPIFRIGGRRVRTMSTFLRFDTASDATVAALKVELMFPADEEAAAGLRELAEPGRSRSLSGK